MITTTHNHSVYKPRANLVPGGQFEAPFQFETPFSQMVQVTEGQASTPLMLEALLGKAALSIHKLRALDESLGVLMHIFGLLRRGANNLETQISHK